MFNKLTSKPPRALRAPTQAARLRQPCTARGAHSARGVSVIELMVGIVVALLVGLAATQSAVMFGAAQRQGIGVGGAAISATSVMSAVRDDVGAAGLGFFGSSTFLCDRLNLSKGSVRLSNGAAFSPLRLQRAASTDTLDVVSGTRVESGANVLLGGASTGASAWLSSFLPLDVGPPTVPPVEPAVLLAPAVPAPGAAPCLVRSVTASTGPTAVDPQLLTFSVAGEHNKTAFTTNPGFAANDRVALLGQLRWSRYQLTGGNLVLTRPMEGDSAILARDVVSFRVQYGVSSASTSATLEDWVDPTGDFLTLSSANMGRVRAVRMGIIVRSPQKEKADASGVCTATVTKPTLFGLDANNITAPDWGCYRYRTSTVVVPLRNFVLGLRS